MIYAVATQRPWGIEAYTALCQECSGHWRLIHDEEGWSLTPSPRYIFCLNWSDYVPPPLLEQHEVVNFHCTALPYGRGGHPIENMILRGHTETVITAHRMTAEVDAGPIYGVSPPVSLAGTKAEILHRFIQPCVDLIRGIIETEPAPHPQGGGVVRFSRLTPAALRAFWGLGQAIAGGGITTTVTEESTRIIVASKLG